MKFIKFTYLLLLTSPFLVQGQVFNYLLSGSQVVSLPTATGSAGFATVELNGTDLQWSVAYEGIGALTNAHFHGVAGPGVNAGVQVPTGTVGNPIVGSATLTGQQVTDFLAGNWYLNLHSSTNPAGELRGQAVAQLPFTPNMLLSGSQVVGGNAVASAGAAQVTFNTTTNQLSWDLAYEGLTGTTTAMHFHGPATAGQNAGVQINLNPTIGVSSDIFSGSTTLSDQNQIDDLLGGLWYVNVHSTAFAGGEIRGQVTPVIVPEPSTFALLGGLIAMTLVLLRGRTSARTTKDSIPLDACRSQ